VKVQGQDLDKGSMA